MTNENVDTFIATLPEKRREQAAVHVRNMMAEQVYNPDYVDAKFYLGRAVDEAWRALKVPYTLYCEISSVSGLHDVISMSKKVNKGGLSVDKDLMAILRTFCAAVLPVALLMKDLKSKTIAGRKPNPEAAAKKAAKALTGMPRATCGCCFGEQAVLPNGRIHDHGYTLPSTWNKSASCYGRRFRPLEVSDEGPKFMVGLAEQSKASLTEAIANLKVATKLSVATKHEWRHGFRVPTEFKDITPEDPEFARIQRERITKTEYSLARCCADLASFQKVVAEWKAA